MLKSSVHRIFLARILEWVATSSSRGSSPPRDQTGVPCVSCIAGRFFTAEPLGKHNRVGFFYMSRKLYILNYRFGSSLDTDLKEKALGLSSGSAEGTGPITQPPGCVSPQGYIEDGTAQWLLSWVASTLVSFGRLKPGNAWFLPWTWARWGWDLGF